MAGICRAAAAMAGICRAAARSIGCRLSSSLLQRRSFGAAAAAVDYDTEWEEDERLQDRQGVRSAEAAWGEMEGRGVQWVFMGNPGPQKRIYAARVAELLEVPYISMGTLVRQELHPGSSIYIKIANAVNEGKLVPVSVIFGLLSKRLEEGYLRGESGFILDGIPRTVMQAEVLDQIADIDLVVNFKCLEDSLMKKHFGSGICSHCGKYFDSGNSESTSLNPCLNTRTQHSHVNPFGSVDIEETRMKKIRFFSEQNKMLEEYYRKQNKLLGFQVSGGARETWRGLLAALHLQHMDAASSSRKLTM